MVWSSKSNYLISQSALVLVLAPVLHAMAVKGAHCLGRVPAPVHRCSVGEVMNILVSTNLSVEAEVLGAVDLPPGTRTVLLDHVPARLSGVGIACHSEGGLRVTSVAGLGLGMGAGAEPAPGATRCAPAALVHALLLGLALVLHLIPLIRGTAAAELVQNLSAAEGEATVGMISEIAGPDLQYKKVILYALVSRVVVIIIKVTVPVLQYHNEALIRTLITGYGIVISKERCRVFIIVPNGI